MYEDIYDAKTAVDHLSGFNVANRYLIVLYYNTSKQSKKVGSKCRQCKLQQLYCAIVALSSSLSICWIRALQTVQVLCHSDKLRCVLCNADRHKGQGRGAQKNAGEVWGGWRAACQSKKRRDMISAAQALYVFLQSEMYAQRYETLKLCVLVTKVPQ